MAGISGTENSDKKDDTTQNSSRDKSERPGDDAVHMNGAGEKLVALKVVVVHLSLNLVGRQLVLIMTFNLIFQ